MRHSRFAQVTRPNWTVTYEVTEVQTLKVIPGFSFLLPWAWAVLLLLCIALYWPNLHAGYFSDDFLFFFDSPPAHLYNYFSQMGAAAHAYRPIEAIVLTIIQKHFRFDTFPIHLLSFCAHSALVCVVLATARRLRLEMTDTLLACTFTFFSQVSV